MEAAFSVVNRVRTAVGPIRHSDWRASGVGAIHESPLPSAKAGFFRPQGGRGPTHPCKPPWPHGWRGIFLALTSALVIFIFRPGLPTAAQETARPSRIDAKSQEILAKCVQALGGDSFLKFRTLYTKGRAFVFFEGETAGMEPFENTTEYPDKRRFAYGKSPPVVLINAGDDGWEIDRYGTIRQPLEQLRRWKIATRYSLENLFREVIHEPGLLVQ